MRFAERCSGVDLGTRLSLAHAIRSSSRSDGRIFFYAVSEALQFSVVVGPARLAGPPASGHPKRPGDCGNHEGFQQAGSLRQATCLLCCPNVVTPSSAGKAHRPVRRIALGYKNGIGTYAARLSVGAMAKHSRLARANHHPITLNSGAMGSARPTDHFDSASSIFLAVSL